MPLDLSVLDAAPVEPSGGAPLELPVDSIDEDPEQPRFEFDDESLAELAETIRERGVRQPVSVRPHPEVAGRWMLNFGARRLRASVLAGRSTVPAFVDVSADSYDQVIENEQRQNLQPLELALFVQRRMRARETAPEIARRLGKSRGYLTFICALIDAPKPVMALYRSGRCRGLAELYELRRLHESEPAAVADWIAVTPSVTRAEVQRLKEDLRQRHAPTVVPSSLTSGDSPPPADEPSGNASGGELSANVSGGQNSRYGADRSSDKTPRLARPPESLRLLARINGEDVTVELVAVPEEARRVFVFRSDDAKPTAVDLDRLQQLRLIRTS
jgi:ParB family chromosome partitioning protein